MSKERPNRAYATKLAEDAIAAGRPTCWAEPFYQEARGNPDFIPWADLEPNPNLLEWVNDHPGIAAADARVLVPGCGLGDDAAFLADLGASVDAFDIAPTAVAWAAQRFAHVRFVTADLLELPREFDASYDSIVEIYTLQVLPQELRAAALEALAACLRPGGHLLIICRGRDDDEPFGELPWGVSKRELSHLQTLGMQPESFEDYIDAHTGSRRFRTLYRRMT